LNPEAFFDVLTRRAEADTRVVATLRRSLGESPGTYPPCFPWIEPFAGQLGDRSRSIVYLAAGLWGLAQRRESGAPVSLPEALYRIGQRRESGSIERRFVALLDADGDELVWRLRHAVQLVASEGLALNWPRLLSDLLAWHYPERRVQQRWAREYWRHATDEGADAGAQTDTTEQEGTTAYGADR